MQFGRIHNWWEVIHGGTTMYSLESEVEGRMNMWGWSLFSIYNVDRRYLLGGIRTRP